MAAIARGLSSRLVGKQFAAIINFKACLTPDYYSNQTFGKQLENSLQTFTKQLENSLQQKEIETKMRV